MNSNECWFGYHIACSAPQTCDCLCHPDEWDEEDYRQLAFWTEEELK